VDLNGFVELDGKLLDPEEIRLTLADDPRAATRFGGEFLLSWNGCTARDPFGIIPGETEPGRVICHGETIGRVRPVLPDLGLEQAILESVRLRGTAGVCALSGGVDSTLVAALAGLPCIAIGTAGSHDLAQARKAAGLIGLECSFFEIGDREIGEALREVVAVIPKPTPVSAALGVAQYLVSCSASELGQTVILSGQGADELFGGYARYLTSPDLAGELGRDIIALKRQVSRDQAVASLHGTRFSLPYLDCRVVRAARAIPPEEKVKDGIRKHPLREVAARYIPAEIAWYEKKALQYGSGVNRALQRFARHNGYKKSVQGYLNQVISETSPSSGRHDHD
jgi:asparagine synthase (glutamine-hydrolysing)